MRRLLVIVGAGVAAFMVVAMMQEWQLFATAWLGASPAAGAGAVARTAATERAEAAVETWLAMMRHLYASGGDRRFGERAPASDEVVAEVLGEVAYLRRQGRRQTMELLRLETLRAEAVSPERVRVVTKEYWVIHTQRLDGGELDPPRAVVVEAEYAVEERQRTWVVIAAGRAG